MNLPPYPSFPTLQDERILLRQIHHTNIPEVLEISFYDAKPAQDLEEGTWMQEKINQDYQKGESIHWGIVDLESNQIVGTCGYYRGLATGTGEIGCVLKSAFYGKGYMSAALRIAISFGLETIGLDRIVAITGRQNIPAIKLLNRLKFVKTADLDDEQMEFQFL